VLALLVMLIVALRRRKQAAATRDEDNMRHRLTESSRGYGPVNSSLPTHHTSGVTGLSPRPAPAINCDRELVWDNARTTVTLSSTHSVRSRRTLDDLERQSVASDAGAGDAHSHHSGHSPRASRLELYPTHISLPAAPVPFAGADALPPPPRSAVGTPAGSPKAAHVESFDSTLI
jgi:hypothetical protein